MSLLSISNDTMHSSNVTLRVLSSADYEAVSAVFKAVFPAKYNLEFHDAWESRNIHLTYGAFTSEEELAGFLLTKQTAANQQQIEFLGVNPNCQKGGIGTILLEMILDYCQKTKSRATLIPVNEHRIIQWYKKHGFKEYGHPRISEYTGDLEQTMIYS